MLSGSLVNASYLAPGAVASVAFQPELILLVRQRGLCGVDHLVNASYLALGAMASVEFHPELI